jgi:hypothetical protein
VLQQLLLLLLRSFPPCWVCSLVVLAPLLHVADQPRLQLLQQQQQRLIMSSGCLA